MPNLRLKKLFELTSLELKPHPGSIASFEERGEIHKNPKPAMRFSKKSSFLAQLLP